MFRPKLCWGPLVDCRVVRSSLDGVTVDSQKRHREKHDYDKRNQGWYEKRAIAPRAGCAEDRFQSEHQCNAHAEDPQRSPVKSQLGRFRVQPRANWQETYTCQDQDDDQDQVWRDSAW